MRGVLLEYFVFWYSGLFTVSELICDITNKKCRDFIEDARGTFSPMNI